MKFPYFVLVSIALSLSAFSQKPDEVLATASGLTFTTSSLSVETRNAYLGRSAAIAAERSDILRQIIRDTVIDAEARASSTTPTAVIAAEFKKIAEPTAAEIKVVYDANRQSIGDASLEQVKPQILGFLRNSAELKAMSSLVERLKIKHKVTVVNDMSSAVLKPTDVIFTVGTRSFTASELEPKIRPFAYDTDAEIVAQTLAELDSAIFSALIAQEAKARSIEAGDLIAAEVTNKLRDFSPEERSGLETALKKKLFDKYVVKIVLKEPHPVAHTVSADDDPIFGNAAAPVTVIMFSDFQCSACSATHPVLKKVVGSYGDKVRLVVRDFPLESIHENAFQAALAANAAKQQGKYYEFIDVLYRNQADLDATSLRKYAAELGLNLKQFELDLSDERSAAEVRKDMADALSLGARGTPTIFVNGVKINRLSADAFRSAIDNALLKAPSKQ